MNSADKKYVIGIDAGATCTNILVSSGGKIEKELKYASLSFTVLGSKKTVLTLKGYIKDCLDVLQTGECYSIAAGIAGARSETDRNIIEQEIKKVFKNSKIKIMTDTEIALNAAFGKDEIKCGILIAGTGSILYYKNEEGQVRQSGGWGRYIGDEGSGYWIGREALNEVCKFYDGYGNGQRLAKLFKEKFGLKKENIVKEIYHNDFDIASLARSVFESAYEDDKLASQIIMKASIHLASLLEPAAKNGLKLALAGSLLTTEKLLKKYLTEIIKKKYSGVKLLNKVINPAEGALKAAEGL